MNVDTAKKLAKTRSRGTIDRWCEQHPGLSRRIGKAIHLHDERFFDLITTGTGLLDWEQAKTYAASLVSEHYLCSNLDFLMELENLIPDSAEWFRSGGGYYSTPCVDWRSVAKLCYEHRTVAEEAQRGYERAKRGVR